MLFSPQFIVPKRRLIVPAGGGPAFRFTAANGGANFGPATSFTYTSGANSANIGDVIIIAAGGTAANTDTGSLLPAGYTSLFDSFDSGGVGSRFSVGYKVAIGAGAISDTTGTLTAASTGSWALIVYSANSSPIDASNGVGVGGSFGGSPSGGNMTTTSISPASSADMLVMLSASFGGLTPYTNFGGGSTARVNLDVSPGSENYQIMIAEKQLSASGATGTFTATQGLDFTYVTSMIAIK